MNEIWSFEFLTSHQWQGYRLLVTQPISKKGLFVYFTGLKGLKFLFLSEFLAYLSKLPGSTAKISGKFSRLRRWKSLVSMQRRYVSSTKFLELSVT